MEQLGGRLVLLVLEEAPHERFARILLKALVVLGGIGTRQQHARLDVDEGRRHHEELSRDVEIQLLHQRDEAEVLLGDERDGDVVDVHLVLANEVDQQVERPLERIELDPVRVRR